MILTIGENLESLHRKSGTAGKEEAQAIIKRLEHELAVHPVDGAGLAAPQIGIRKRVAIVRMDGVHINLINPEIVDVRRMFLNKGEGCLSIPNRRFNIWRYNEIVFKDDLHPNGVVAEGEPAVAIQHETDHLDGVLLIDKPTKVGRNDPCPCGRKKNGKPVKFKRCHGR